MKPKNSDVLAYVPGNPSTAHSNPADTIPTTKFLCTNGPPESLNIKKLKSMYEKNRNAFEKFLTLGKHQLQPFQHRWKYVLCTNIS